MHISKEIKANVADAVEFEDAVSLTGFGKYNIGLLITCGGLLMAVITETMSMSYILPAAQCDFDLTLSEKAILSAVSFAGVVLSSHLWGFIGDTLGRKKLILITTYISYIMSVLSSICPYVWLFILLRFLNGFFIGGASAVIYAYLGEFHDDIYRPKVISWASTFVALATIFLPGVAWLILPMTWSFYIPLLNIQMKPWRLLILIYATPSVVCASSLLQFSESPKFLWVHGKSSKALEILRSMYVSNTGYAEYTYSARKLVASTEIPIILNDINDEGKKNIGPSRKVFRFFILMWNQTIPLFRYPFLSNIFMTSALQFGIFASSSGFLMWLPDLLNKLSTFMMNHPNSTVIVCEALEANKHFQNLQATEIIPDCTDHIDEEVFRISLILGAAFGCTYLIIGNIISILGKKLLLVIMLLVTGLGGLSISFVPGYTNIIIIMGLFVSAGTCVSVTNTVVVDLFPTQYRAMAIAISLMMGRCGAVAGSHIVGYLLEYNCSAAFYIFGGEHFVLLILALLIPIPLFLRKKKISS